MAEEEASIIGKPTAEEELAADEAPVIEEWRAGQAGMHKHNRVAEVAKPPPAAVEPANAASEPAESTSLGQCRECYSAEAKGGCGNPQFQSTHHRLPFRA
jgi:hypothetical protein